MPEQPSEFVSREPREHNERHLGFIRGLPCCICHDNTSTEAAHVRYGSPQNGKRYVGKGEKPSDKWTVPLCGRHHAIQHQIGEREFWLIAGIDPVQLAADLFACTGDHATGERIVMRAHAR